MNRSESIVNISKALLKAQKNIGAAVKGSANPFFKSRYADLGAVMEACKDALNEQGISVLQPVVSDESGSYVETILLHESGEFLSGRMKIMEGKNMQELGSGVSYARRYGLQSIAFIPSEDDDGNIASGKVNNASTITNGNSGYQNQVSSTVSKPAVTSTVITTTASEPTSTGMSSDGVSTPITVNRFGKSAEVVAAKQDVVAPVTAPKANRFKRVTEGSTQ